MDARRTIGFFAIISRKVEIGMPTGTIELPRSMIKAANSFADRESLSIAEWFGMMLNRQYGYKVTIAVAKPRDVRRISISPRVHSLRGIARMANEKPYRDLIADAVSSRYEDMA